MLGSLLLITLPHGWHIPWPLFGFFAVMLVWRFMAVRYPGWLPKRWQLFLLTLLGVALLLSQQRGVFGRDAGTGLIVVALGLKLLEIRGRRDVLLVVYLAFIVAASQFLYEQSILMAGYILLVCILLLATLIVQTAERVETRAALKTATAIVLQALPLALVLFVLFPRLEAPRWMWLADDNKALSGLSDTLEPGSISDLSLSDELVFRVRFEGDVPPPLLRYWRGAVYSRTDGVRWTVDSSRDTSARPPEFSGDAYRYTLLMEPQKQNWVFGLEMPESFGAGLRSIHGFQLRSDKRPADRAEYKIVSRPFYNTGPLSPADYRENLQLPLAASDRQLALIKALGGGNASPEQFIQNLLNHFRREAFFYTLAPPLMPENPIDTFLFETRSGFCSHYAAAFVYLLRIAKIPARVIGGYQGGEFNKVGGFLEVRQADAHAWAEAWLENKGWVRFDPTAAVAPERVERGVNVDLQIASGAVNFGPLTGDSAALNWFKRGRQLWQSVDYNWQRWVINYSGANQMQFLRTLGIDGISPLVKWLLGSLLAVTLPLAWWLLKKPAKTADKPLLVYRRFCGKLADAGVVIGQGEGAKDFAGRAQKQLPELAGRIEQISALFIRLRYQADAKAGDLQRLKNLVDAFSVKKRR
ncbi:transglutaminase TgpA family protein [Methylomonas subterranea]|uniref:transglutaminase TgpA family protein n=1 Tax=Methylomonas subterranea TaxID=2952225 RepID=UPI003531C14C